MVVETDEISTKIIRYLTSLKGGRITFIPLNRVKSPHVNFPKSSDVVPLLQKLKYVSHYAPAFGQVGSYECMSSLSFFPVSSLNIYCVWAEYILDYW